MSSTDCALALTSFVLVWLLNLGSGILTLSTQPGLRGERRRRSTSTLAFWWIFSSMSFDDAGHRGAQAGQVGAAVTLGMLLVKHSTCSV